MECLKMEKYCNLSEIAQIRRREKQLIAIGIAWVLEGDKVRKALALFRWLFLSIIIR